MEPKKYNEYEITFRDGEIFRKDLSKRGSVRIDDETAKVMNANYKRSGILYELAEESDEKSEKELRKELFEKAAEKGITVAKNIKTEDLQKLINK